MFTIHDSRKLCVLGICQRHKQRFHQIWTAHQLIHWLFSTHTAISFSAGSFNRVQCWTLTKLSMHCLSLAQRRISRASDCVGRPGACHVHRAVYNARRLRVLLCSTYIRATPSIPRYQPTNSTPHLLDKVQPSRLARIQPPLRSHLDRPRIAVSPLPLCFLRADLRNIPTHLRIYVLIKPSPTRVRMSGS